MYVVNLSLNQGRLAATVAATAAATRRDAPKLLTGLLVAAGALHVYGLWSASHRVGNENRLATNAAAELSPNVTTLFGIPHDEHPVLSSAGIKLLGTMAFVGESTHGMAIVDVNGHSRLWVVGTNLEDALLREVYPDYILIERAGRSERVEMPRSQSGRANTRLTAHHTPAAPPPLTHEAIHHRIEAATAPLAAVLKAEPLMNGDQYSGLIVEPNGNAYAFKQLGLKPGDVIMAVNQRQLNPDTLKFLNDDIRSGRAVHLYVNRPGVGPTDVRINTSAITQ